VLLFLLLFTTENHAKMYTQMGQAVPQSVSLVLEGARRKEHKKHAKREANRRSASSSRARKRALMEEMAEVNARLRRQALILSLLPDLVIVIDPHDDCVISFCSAQVENILRHSVDDVIGARLTDLLVPASKAKLQLLVKQLVGQASHPDLVPNGRSLEASEENNKAGDNNQKAAKKSAKKKDDAKGDKKLAPDEAAAKPVDSTSGNAADASFPPPEVEFKNKKSGLSDDNENSDGSRSKEPSSLTASAAEIDNSDNSATNSATNNNKKEPPASSSNNNNHIKPVLPRSPTGSSLGNSGSEEGGGAEPNEKSAPGQEAVAGTGVKGLVHKNSSDTSNTSSLSTTAKKLQKANANLERNVRWHNKKMKAGQTANNATARLSSLQHRSESSSSEEDDSGYRESNDSREETTSSATSDSDETNGKAFS
jgi:hypothetical protein